MTGIPKGILSEEVAKNISGTLVNEMEIKKRMGKFLSQMGQLDGFMPLLEKNRPMLDEYRAIMIQEIMNSFKAANLYDQMKEEGVFEKLKNTLPKEENSNF